MSTSIKFYLKHWSSGKFIHPRGGTASNDVSLVTHVGFGPQVQYYFDYQEGPWGYLVWAQDPKYCVHPDGGEVDAENDTKLVFHEGRHPGAYFALNQNERTIVHISGKYWHPDGGMSNPSNDNDIVLFDGTNNNTKFYAVDGKPGKAVSLALPVKPATTTWKLLFADDNPRMDYQKTFMKKIGMTETHKSQTSLEVTAALEMAGEIFGIGSKASLEVKNAFSTEDSKTWSATEALTDKFQIKAGQPVARWQRVYIAQFEDGKEYQFDSIVTYDTESSKILPPN